MVAMWVPQVEEMFNGDYEMIVQVQTQQANELEEQFRQEDPGEETEEDSLIF